MNAWAASGNKRFFYFHDILRDLIIKRGRKVEEANCSISMLILWASAAYGANNGASANLDIMGSLANNTTFISPEGMPVVVDIVGSTANNIQIGNPRDEVKRARAQRRLDLRPMRRENELYYTMGRLQEAFMLSLEFIYSHQV